MAIVLDSLDKKLFEQFRGYVVKKDLVRELKLGDNVPVFVLEYLLANSCSTTDEDQLQKGIQNVKKILHDHYVTPDESGKVQSRIKESQSYTIIDRIEVNLEAGKDKYWAHLLNSNIRHANIDDYLVVEHDKLLMGGIWAIIDIGYDTEIKFGNKIHPFVIKNIKPIQLSSFDGKKFKEGRSHFTKDEWLDVLTRSVGMEPTSEGFDRRLKMLLISRLIPLVESNFNLIELGPRMTGKSYVYKEISPYAILLSGGQATVAQLFVNNATRKVGLVGNWDTVAFDEIAGIRFKDGDGVQIMKDYMESGSFSRGGGGEMTGSASMVFNGNINQPLETLLKTSHLFNPLPDTIRNDTAFLDRLHFYLPGWEVLKLSPSNFTNSFGFSMDYFSETLKFMRKFTYADIVDTHFTLGAHLKQRDSKAVKKTVSGFIKLLHPDGNYTKEDVQEYLEIAMEMRRRVKEQLKKIGGMEFWDTNFSYVDRESQEEKYVALPEERGSNLIDHQPLQPGFCYTVSQDDDGMSLIQIEVNATQGNGKLNISGTSKQIIKENIRNVHQFIKANEKTVLSQEHSLNNYDLSIQLTNLMGTGIGPNIGGAVFVAFISAIYKRHLKAGLSILGDISISGGISRVDNFSDKLAMLSENGSLMTLCPMENLNEMQDIPPSILNNTDVNFYSNSQMILQKSILNE